MTLVVGMATQDIAFLVSDTLLSSSFELKGHAGPVNGKFHALKIQILSPNTAVAFATSNDAATCLRIISILHRELLCDPRISSPDRLLELYRQAIETTDNRERPDCEFLVLRLTPSGRKLAHVTKKRVFECERAYIGDPLAYRQLIGLKTPYTPPRRQLRQQPDGTFFESDLHLTDGEVEFEEISRAMENLSNKNGSVGAIGDCILRVVDARNSGDLEYLQSVEASLTPWEGRSGFSMLASNKNRRGVGIFYRSGKIGYVFAVGDPEYCRKESANSLTQFVEQAREKYGLNLVGGTFDD